MVCGDMIANKISPNLREIRTLYVIMIFQNQAPGTM